MLLAVDIGNTDIVFGLWGNAEWLAQLRHPTGDATGAPQAVRHWLQEEKMTDATVKKLVISSVVPSVTATVQNDLEQEFDVPALILGSALYQRLPIRIDNPEEIGSDLVANAFAAFHRFGQACIVVDFGTALTFTTISGKGEILGVAIAPGLNTAMESLFAKTARLHKVPLDLPESVIGKNTTHALQAGILWGYVGLVNDLLDRIIAELGREVKVVATGGLSRVLQPLSVRFDQVDPLLTLEGLRLIHDEFG
jgi:type III pantothenate kinase